MSLSVLMFSGGRLTAQTPNHAPFPEIGPWVTGTYHGGSLSLTIKWHDDGTLDFTSRVIKLNGTSVAGSFTHNNAGAPPTSTGSITLATGANLLEARICDTTGRCTTSHAYYISEPKPAQQAYGAAAVYLTDVSEGIRTVSPFDATTSYATPAYVSGDAPRSATLVYTASQAVARASVRVIAHDNSQNVPSRMSILVRDSATGTTVAPESFYLGRALRLFANWNATSVSTGARTYDLVVRSYWDVSRGAPKDTMIEAPVTRVRVLVLNEGSSPFGTGWTLAGLHRLHSSTGGALVTHGDGTAVYFHRTCGTCAYQAPEGEFSRLVANVDGTHTRTYPDGSVARYRSDGLLDYAEDRFGNRTSFTYSSGLLTTITDPFGKQTGFTYSGGKVSEISTPGGRVSKLYYTGSNLTRIVDPDTADALRLTYDGQNRLASVRVRGAGAVGLAYDAVGLLAADTLPAVSINGGATQRPVIRYTSNEVRIAGGSSGSPAAAPANLRGLITDARGNVRETHLNRFGLEAYVIEPHGHTTIIERNANGQVLRVTGTTGAVVNNAWQGPALARSYTPVDGSRLSIDYDTTYYLPTHVVDRTQETLTYYGSLGAVDSVRAGAGQPVTAYTSDSRGRVLSATNPEGVGAFFSYGDVTFGNPWGNLDLVEVGAVSTGFRRTAGMYYDGYGRDTMTLDPNNDGARTRYDNLNRARRVIGPLNDTTTVAYDSLGLASITDPKGQVHRYERNVAGWVEREIDPRNDTTLYRYDLNGNVASSVNRRGQTISFAYDSLDRVASRTADGTQTTWTYGPKTRWVEVANALGTDRIDYDSIGRAVRETTTRGTRVYTRDFQLNSAGARTQLSATGPWSGTRTIRYRYDALMRLDTLTDLAGGHTVFDFDDAGQEVDRVYPTFAGNVRGYASVFRPYEITFQHAALDSVLSTRYAYDTNGRVGARMSVYSDPGGLGDLVRAYTHDAAGRLTGYEDDAVFSASPGCTNGQDVDPDGGFCPPAGLSLPLGSESYSFDLAGNRTDHGASVQTGNRLVSFDGFTLEYDADGNLTRKYTGSGYDQRLYWNSLGQLDSVSTNGSKVRYAYDGLGRRVRRVDASTTVESVYDGDDLFMELDGSGDILREYTHIPGVDQPLSVRDWAGSSGAVFYYAADHPGHVAGLFNASNQVVAQYDYSPWGVDQNTIASVQQPLRFMGRELEGATGLYYVRSRWYDPAQGRFVSEDPTGLLGGLNPYAYAGNSPTSLLDPYGFAPGDDDCVLMLIALDVSAQLANAICGNIALSIPGVSSIEDGWLFSTPREAGATANFGNRGYSYEPRSTDPGPGGPAGGGEPEERKTFLQCMGNSAQNLWVFGATTVTAAGEVLEKAAEGTAKRLEPEVYRLWKQARVPASGARARLATMRQGQYLTRLRSLATAGEYAFVAGAGFLLGYGLGASAMCAIDRGYYG